MFIQEGQHGGAHHGRIERRVAMAGASDSVKHRMGLRVFQRVEKELALLPGHQQVAVTVGNEKRRGIARDISDGIGLRHFVEVFLDGAADQPGFRRV